MGWPDINLVLVFDNNSGLSICNSHGRLHIVHALTFRRHRPNIDVHVVIDNNELQLQYDGADSPV